LLLKSYAINKHNILGDANSRSTGFTTLNAATFKSISRNAVRKKHNSPDNMQNSTNNSNVKNTAQHLASIESSDSFVNHKTIAAHRASVEPPNRGQKLILLEE